MADVERKLDAVFFRSEKGNEPVREWLQLLPKAERKVIGSDVLKVQYCWPIDMPLVRSLGHGLWEIRSRLGDRIARVIFCVNDRTTVLLHGFVKKSQKTPKHDLDLARQRMNQFL
ncbi:MAG TPA: type II toxin-antitoxin system RelE/ParE family toxin [Tepidisphaeraceae bacterium]|nr:type II toxin-antitoxin system RelE/ParE family toxin [Tepidisphaeraceae bacterium]